MLVGSALDVACEDFEVFLEVDYRLAVGVVVVNAEAATDVDYCDLSAEAFDVGECVVDFVAELFERLEVANLRASEMSA